MKPQVVSVIIPVFNGEKYLGEAIESVIAQTYRFVETIVIDDGSTDNSASVARRFGESVKYFHQTNQGTGAARNRGASLSGGDFLAFLDQDDLWLPDKLYRQMQVFAAVPDLDIVFGHLRQFHSPDLDECMKLRVNCIDRNQPGYSPSAMFHCRRRISGLIPVNTIHSQFHTFIQIGAVELSEVSEHDIQVWNRSETSSGGIIYPVTKGHPDREKPESLLPRGLHRVGRRLCLDLSGGSISRTRQNAWQPMHYYLSSIHRYGFDEPIGLSDHTLYGLTQVFF